MRWLESHAAPEVLLGHTSFPELAEAEASGHLDEVIAGVRTQMDADARAALTDPWLSGWLGRRFRHIFIDECQADPQARSAARPNRLFGIIGADGRTERRRLADKYLRVFEQEAPYIDMPPADEPSAIEQTLVFAPGMLAGALPSPALHSVFPRVEDRFGIRVARIDAHPVRSVAGNVEDVVALLDGGGSPRGFDAAGDPLSSPVEGEVVLFGYSKGIADITETMIARPDLNPRIRAVIGWGGATRGSYLADDLHARLEGIANVENPTAAQARDIIGRVAPWAPLPPLKRLTERMEDWDAVGCMRDMTTSERDSWWAANGKAIDATGIPFLTVAGAARVVEVPWYQAMGSAQLLLRDPMNDMQVTVDQAKVPVPMSAHLATVRAHHWDLCFDGFPIWARLGSHGLSNTFAKYAAVSATVLLMNEIGLLGLAAGGGNA